MVLVTFFNEHLPKAAPITYPLSRGPPGHQARTLLAPGKQHLYIIRDRVIKARDIPEERYKNHPGIYCDAQISSKMLKEICVISHAGANLLKAAMEKLNLSARAYDRSLKVSRTNADLSASEDIKPEHLAEAHQGVKQGLQ